MVLVSQSWHCSVSLVKILWVHLTEIDMPEISLKRRLVRALEDADVVRVSSLLESSENLPALREESLEVVEALSGYLSLHTLHALPHLATCCQAGLVTVAREGNPKEVLVSLLERLDSFQSAELVVRVLPSLATVLTRLKPASMSVSWNWALSTVASHLKVRLSQLTLRLSSPDCLLLRPARLLPTSAWRERSASLSTRLRRPSSAPGW